MRCPVAGGGSVKSVALLAILCCCSASLFAQKGPDIGSYIARIEGGEVEAVREEIPSLLDKYPNNAGVLYLQGLVTADGAEAVRIYQGIVDGFPRSEWADDALYKVYQFYYAIGLYRTAELKLNQLRKEYPESQYIATGSDVDTGKLAEESAHDTTTPGPSGGAAEARDQTRAPETSTDVAQGQFAIQVGAYFSLENAEKQKVFFEDRNYPVEVINRVRESRSLFLVLVGNYLTYDEAKGKAKEVQEKFGISSFVVSR